MSEKQPIRVLVCGGRDYGDEAAVFRVLDQLLKSGECRLEHLILGGCPTGADEYARAWAKLAGVPYLTFPAQWTTHGRSAGPIRNSAMLKEGRPTIVVAFPGGRGTADMVRRTRKAGVPVFNGEEVTSVDMRRILLVGIEHHDDGQGFNGERCRPAAIVVKGRCEECETPGATKLCLCGGRFCDSCIESHTDNRWKGGQ